MTGTKPAVRPARPFFSSGPCAKHPGWTPESLGGAFLGRSHRARGGLAKLKDAIARTKSLLQIPDDYRVAIVPASDTGAVEMAMWNLLGPKPVDLFAWESFGEEWVTDTVKQLKLKDARIFKAPYGELPDLAQAGANNDIVFVWNGTTSGVRVPNADFIAADREGVTICDATSAAFAMPLPWDKLDVTTFSWQKVLGGEAAHGMLVLSPNAVARMEAYSPHWPLPKIFRLTKGGKLIEGLFEGETLNTPSMLAVEDYLEALKWAENIGGLPALYARVNANADALGKWVQKRDWIDFLAKEERYRSTTSVCLKIVEPSLAKLDDDAFPMTFPATATRRRACASGAAPPSIRPTSKPSPTGSIGPSNR
jgi:phosphoserine aminotransferase